MIFDSVDSPSSYLSKNIEYLSSYLISTSDLIDFNEFFENIIILCGFDPYSPLYYLVCNYLSKWVSLELVLTLIQVFSMTSRIHFINGQPLDS